MVIDNFVDKVFALATLLTHLIIIIFIFSFLYFKKKSDFPNFVKDLWKYVSDNSLLLAFVYVLLATLGSLIYSEIVGYPACELCWYQRALIYPQVIILGVAFFKKSRKIFDFVLGLNIIGLIIGIYQYYLQMFQAVTNCGIGSVSCSHIYVLEFGYITIPMMSITTFIVSLILTYIARHYHGRKNPRIEIERENIQ